MNKLLIFILPVSILLNSISNKSQDMKTVYDSIKNNPDYAWGICRNYLNQTADSIIIFKSDEVGIHQPVYSITTKAEKRKLDSLSEAFKKAPNPFAPATKYFFYSLSKNSLFKVSIYDTLGSEITTLINTELPYGDYEVYFSLYGILSPNTYVQKVQYDGQIQYRKLIIYKCKTP